MGEIAIALLSKELKFCELSSEPSNSTRIEVKVGKNKRAKIPTKNLIYRSGIHVSDVVEGIMLFINGGLKSWSSKVLLPAYNMGTDKIKKKF